MYMYISLAESLNGVYFTVCQVLLVRLVLITRSMHIIRFKYHSKP